MRMSKRRAPPDNEKTVISPYQVFALLVISRLVPVTIVFPLVSASPDVQDLWLGAALSLPIAGLYSVLVVRLGEAFPGKSIVEIVMELLGPVLGRLAASMLIVSWILSLTGMLRSIAEVHVAAIMTETPLIVFVVLVASAAIYAARTGLEPISRCAEVVLITVFIFFLPLIILPLRRCQLSNLTPILAHGWRPTTLPALQSISFYTQFSVVGMLLPHLRKPKTVGKYVIGAVLTSGSFMTAFVIVLTMSFGSLLTAITFPAFQLARIVSVANFIERTESLGLVAWTMTTSLKSALFLWACSTALAQMLNIQGWRTFVPAFGFLTSGLAVTAFDSSSELHDFYSVRVFGTSLISIHLLLILLVVGGLLWRKVKGKSPAGKR